MARNTLASKRIKPLIIALPVVGLLVAGLIVGFVQSHRPESDTSVANNVAKYPNNQSLYQPQRDTVKQQAALSESQGSDQSEAGSNAQSNTVEAGQTVKVAVVEDSGSRFINTVQATLLYPADKLQFVSVGNNQAFSVVAATDTSQPGQVQLARATTPGTNGLSGSQAVAVVVFKALVSGVDTQSAVSIDKTSSLLVTSDTNQNILGLPSASLSLR